MELRGKGYPRARWSRTNGLLLVCATVAAVVAADSTQEEQQLRALAGKTAAKYTPNVHRCVHRTTKLSKQTAQGTPCFNCDPALNECPVGCQQVIDDVYHMCNGICLPDGYYFDPESQLEECFAANRAAMKIGVERCGCNAAFRLSGTAASLAFALLLSLTLLLAAF